MSKNLLEQKSGAFYDPWEELSSTQREPLMREHLAEYVRFARERSPFYNDRLQDFDIRAEHPLAKVPVLTSTELRANLPPQGKAMLTRDITDHGGYSVFQSGGTTGMPKTTLFTHDELEGINACNARGFYATGLRAEDRVANLWAVGGLYMTFIHMNRMLQNYGCMSFPFSNQTPVDFIKTVAKHFDMNVFTGITSVVLNCLKEINRTEPGLLKVEKIYFGGEHIYEADRKELARTFGVKVIQAPGYGTVDTWYIGYQCSHCENGVFHAFDDQVHIEILDEDAARDGVAPHCDPGEIGMLHVTAFPRKLTPVIRYRVGDRAKWLKDPCPCGRTTPLFHLLGRGDDVLRIGYDSVDYNAVQSVVSGIPGLSGMVQIEKERQEGRDRLVIRIETQSPESAQGETARQLSKQLAGSLEKDRPSLSEFIKKGTIWPTRVELLPPGGLPLNPRTGKLIRVKDAI